MPRKKKQKTESKEEIQETQEENVEKLFIAENKPVGDQINWKADLLALIDTFPSLPPLSNPKINLIHELVANYTPQIIQFKQRLKEFAECLP